MNVQISQMNEWIKKKEPFDDLDVGGGALLRPFFQHFNLLHALIRISDCAIFTQFQSQTQSLQDGRRKSRINKVDIGGSIIEGEQERASYTSKCRVFRHMPTKKYIQSMRGKNWRRIESEGLLGKEK